MASLKCVTIAALLLAVSGGAAVAQMDQPRTGFYADPVMPDPSPAVHAFAAAEATADVAAVSPAAGAAQKPQHEAVCNARNPCAVTASPARG